MNKEEDKYDVNNVIELIVDNLGIRYKPRKLIVVKEIPRTEGTLKIDIRRLKNMIPTEHI